MKYVSPTTEKRRQQQKKQKQQKIIAVAIICVALVFGISLFFIFSNWTKDKKGESIVNTPPPQETPNIDSSVEDTDSVPPSENSETDDGNTNGTDSSTATQDSETDSSTGDKDSTEKEPENSTNQDSEQDAPQTDDKTQPTKPKKQSFFQKIKNIFTKQTKTKQEIVFPVTAFGRTIEESATSIASLSPTATEALLSLPVQSQIVAVSEYCNKRGKEMPTIGTPLIPQVDKIISINPEYLIVQAPLNGTDKIKIEQSGIKILQISLPKTIEELKEIYRSISALVYGKDIAVTISDNVINDFENKIELYNQALPNVTKQTALLLYNKYGMVATSDSLEGNILNNFFSPAVQGSGYYAGNLEQLVLANPQVLIVSDQLTPEEVEQMGFSETDAYKNNKIYYVPIKDFENISVKTIKHLGGIINDVYAKEIKPIDFTQEE